MDNGVIRLLTQVEIVGLRSVFADEWDADLPDPASAYVVAEVEDDELLGFCVVESVVRVGQVFTAPKHREPKAEVARRLFDHVEQRVPAGKSVIVLDDTGGHSTFLKGMGFRKVEGFAYRRDF